jgi:hypothetical protein
MADEDDGHTEHVVIRWTAQSRIKINSQDVTSADLRQVHYRERERERERVTLAFVRIPN